MVSNTFNTTPDGPPEGCCLATKPSHSQHGKFCKYQPGVLTPLSLPPPNPPPLPTDIIAAMHAPVNVLPNDTWKLSKLQKMMVR